MIHRTLRTTLIAVAMLLTANGAAVHAQTSPKIQFIHVDRNVKLEVLDWGGTGRPLVLLAGNSRTAHDFEEIAPLLAVTYHVYGITRRGFGASSNATTGFLADELGNDVLAIVDSLHLTRPVLAGHSLAGQELSSIGSRFPEKVAGLIYLDAAFTYAFDNNTRANFIVDQNELRRGLEALRLAAYKGDAPEVRRLTTRLIKTDLPALERSLREIEKQTPAASTNPPTQYMPPPDTGIKRLVREGMQRFTDVRAPVLAIYAQESMMGIPGDSPDEAVERTLRALRIGAPTARVLILSDATHFVFMSNQAEVLREMRAFIATLPVQ